MKLLMISTDRLIFEKDSAVASRMIEYAKSYEELHIIIFNLKSEDRRAKPELHGSDNDSVLQLSSNCWVYPTNSKTKWFYPFNAVKIGRFLIREKGITNLTCQDPFLTAIAGTSLQGRFSIPLEIQLHTDIGSPYFTYNFKNKIFKMLANRYLPRADKIRVVSDRIKYYLVHNMGIMEFIVEVRPISVDIEWIKIAPVTSDLHWKYPQFDKMVLMASRLEPEKNIALAIKAWANVLKRFPKAGLIIVGNGSEKSNLKNKISKMGLSNSVMMEDMVNQPTLVSYYKTANLFLNTSLYEGYGMTLVEAQAAGCKIISTDVGVAKDVGARIVENETNKVACAIIEELS